jgi:hypothetical protein
VKPALAHLPEGEFETPHGPIVGRVTELYVGLDGHLRVCLADRMGRVSHYDVVEVAPIGDPHVVSARTSMDPEHIMISVVKEAVAA